VDLDRTPAKLLAMAREKRAYALNLRRLAVSLSLEASRARMVQFADDEEREAAMLEAEARGAS